MILIRWQNLCMQKKKEKFRDQFISHIIFIQLWSNQILLIISKKMLEHFFLILNIAIEYKQENLF